jgi:hypothetical protein
VPESTEFQGIIALAFLRMPFHDTNMVAARMQFWAFKCSGQKIHSEIMFKLEKRKKTVK